MANATTCASKINSCYKEANTIIEKKQTQMKAHAANYNSLVSGVIAQQQVILNQVKAQVIADAEYIKQFIPGGAYEFPADLFIEMPEEMMVGDLGVALRGGEELTSLDDLETKMGLLIGMLEDQQTTVVAQLDKYINDQSSNIQDEAAKWASLKDECKTAEANYNAAANEANAQMAETYNDALNFCQKYAAMATNPAAGCGDADGLYEDAMNVSSQFLSNAGAIKSQAIQYKNFCNSANNEGTNGSDSSTNDDKGPTSEEILFDDLAFACEDFKEEEDDKDFLSSLSSQIFNTLPAGTSSSDQDALEDFFKDPSERPQFSSVFRRSTFYRTSLSSTIDSVLKMNTDYTKPEIPEGLKLDPKTVADLDKWDELGFCNRYLVESEINVVNSCMKDNRGSESEKDCLENAKDQAFVSESTSAKGIARAIASINESVTTSDSGRIGEQMNGVPCMAQQGNNGSNGGNIFSGLSGAAQSLLGIGNNVFGQ